MALLQILPPGGRQHGQWGMPPPSAYTPFESLLFFQSLAAFDSRPASFAAISNTLRNNAFIREDAAFDPERLTPEALEELYTTLLRDRASSDNAVANSDVPARAESSVANNPKKRKATSPRPEGLGDLAPHATAVPDLVAHLYARYKELVTREIRNEEKRFREVRDEIQRLQNEAHEASGPPAVQEPVHHPHKPIPEPVSGAVADTDNPATGVQPSVKTQGAKPPIESTSVSEAQVEKPVENLQAGLSVSQPQVEATGSNVEQGLQPQPQHSGQPQNLAWQQPQLSPQTPVGRPLLPHPLPVNGRIPSAEQQTSTGTLGRPAEPTNVSTLAQAPTASQAPAPIAPPAQTTQQVRGIPAPSRPSVPPAEPIGKDTSNVAGPVTSVRPRNQPHIQQWHLNEPPQTPHHPVPSQVPAPQSVPAASKMPIPSAYGPEKPHTGKPYQPPYVPALPTTPRPAPGQVNAQAPTDHDQGYAPQASLSEPRNARWPSVGVSISLTPWKRLPRLSIPDRPRSPVRPRPEDISPISDRAPSPTEPLEAPSEKTGTRRRKRQPAEEKERGATASDVDQRPGKRTRTEKSAPSGRKKRDGSTPSSKSRRSMASREEGSPIDSTSQGRIKQEAVSTPIGVPESTEPNTPAVSDRKGGTAAPQAVRRPRGRPKRKRSVSEAGEQEPAKAEPSRPDPNQYVLCARNFPRTGAPIMNEVTAHKHASIFTKPLTERDAPGYRDLIYRPQDLKSIKSSISQGGKAVTAASEAMSTPTADGESPVPGAGTPSKNATLMLQKTEDLIPPKAIVNSAQLEKELIRMFANAVMYNPTPQRGFGPAFPMISDTGSRASTETPEADEGGIVNDALEMFEDVEKAVTGWRAAERTADEPAQKGVLAARRGSVSDVNPDSTDDNKG